MSGAGDVNADGVPDVMVGAPGDSPNGDFSGSAFVFSGADGSLLYSWSGGADSDVGIAVAGVGDLNADGFDDVIVGADDDDTNGNSAGRATVYSGATGGVLFTWYGDEAYDHFGDAVAGAGDVNADGVPDVIVGETHNSGARDKVGAATVFSGADGSPLHSWSGDSPNDWFGWGVAGAGDVDQDGYDDVIVGAQGDQVNGANSGSAYVFSGATGDLLYAWHGDSADDYFGFAVAGAGDVDGDGIPDLAVPASADDGNGDRSGVLYVFSGADGTTLGTWYGAPGDGLGRSVAGAGDVNGDGLADVICSGVSANEYAGVAYVFAYDCDSTFGLTVDGSCPGSMNFIADGASPGGTVAFIYAFGQGNARIPSGPCAGTTLGLNATARLGGTRTADANGIATLSTSVPPAACGRVFVQALDLETCTTSNVEGL